jgi:hypothetical protein
MGNYQTKPQSSRNYLLDVKRRQKLYGFSPEVLEEFWASSIFREYGKEYYITNPAGSLLEEDIAASNSYIDTWNKWKTQNPKLKFHPNLPYEFKPIYYPDMFNEFLYIEYRFAPTLFGPVIPKRHLKIHFNNINNFYKTDVGQEHLKKRNIKCQKTFVNTLLDQYEYSLLVNMIVDKYGEVSWSLSQ